MFICFLGVLFQIGLQMAASFATVLRVFPFNAKIFNNVFIIQFVFKPIYQSFVVGKQN
ncbi:MAG: hypothetical protein ACPLRO_01950 [Candidatus Kapaibacteriota bacterium]